MTINPPSSFQISNSSNGHKFLAFSSPPKIRPRVVVRPEGEVTASGRIPTSMTLRSLDNTLPIERPKKVAKIAAGTTPPRKAVLVEAARDPPRNDENAAPAPVAEQAVKYVASEDLNALPDPEAKCKVLLDDLGSKDWIAVCAALNDARCLALHHSSLMVPILEKVILVIVKAMKNPRSALCKTSIMASKDVFHSYGHQLLSSTESFNQLLLQLLLKASQDKKFVCEEAERALETMAVSMSPVPLLQKLQTYVNHANLRVRAKAAFAISKCLSSMGAELMKEFGLATLLQIAAEFLNDRLPEAREAARNIINSIHAAFLTQCHESDSDLLAAEAWQNLCSSSLSPISAQSVAKLISQ